MISLNIHGRRWSFEDFVGIRDQEAEEWISVDRRAVLCIRTRLDGLAVCITVVPHTTKVWKQAREEREERSHRQSLVDRLKRRYVSNGGEDNAFGRGIKSSSVTFYCAASPLCRLPFIPGCRGTEGRILFHQYYDPPSIPARCCFSSRLANIPAFVHPVFRFNRTFGCSFSRDHASARLADVLYRLDLVFSSS